jgi:hypothetical protein
MEFLLAGEFEMDLLLLLGKHSVSKIVRVHKLLKKNRAHHRAVRSDDETRLAVTSDD